jgi:hypothetical protein
MTVLMILTKFCLSILFLKRNNIINRNLRSRECNFTCVNMNNLANLVNTEVAFTHTQDRSMLRSTPNRQRRSKTPIVFL